MEKAVVNVFGEHYLLGVGASGTKYYLEKESWDCGWYWGFGYVHSYTNNRCPSASRDIATHNHFNNMFLDGPRNGFDEFKLFFADTVLTDNEIWTFIELMKTAYILREAAEVFGRGGAHYTTNPCADIIKNPDYVDKINKELLPEIFDKVKELLTP